VEEEGGGAKKGVGSKYDQCPQCSAADAACYWHHAAITAAAGVPVRIIAARSQLLVWCGGQLREEGERELYKHEITFPQIMSTPNKQRKSASLFFRFCFLHPLVGIKSPFLLLVSDFFPPDSDSFSASLQTKILGLALGQGDGAAGFSIIV
jgi:hypothetical protein